MKLSEGTIIFYYAVSMLTGAVGVGTIVVNFAHSLNGRPADIGGALVDGTVIVALSALIQAVTSACWQIRELDKQEPTEGGVDALRRTGQENYQQCDNVTTCGDHYDR